MLGLTTGLVGPLDAGEPLTRGGEVVAAAAENEAVVVDKMPAVVAANAAVPRLLRRRWFCAAWGGVKCVCVCC